MNLAITRTLGAVPLAALLALPLAAADKPELIGVGAIPGTATDGSGLTGLLEDGVTPGNLVGGLGSAIAYTGYGDLYMMTPDRGPADGTTSYVDRAYVVKIDVRRSHADPAGYVVSPRILSTRLLSHGWRKFFTGKASAFDPTNSPASARLDPEGIRLARCGAGFYVSDEYGPFLYEFRPNGRRERVIDLPRKFLIDLPSANPTTELTGNAFGRQSNRGMEGLAISPDGSKLYGMMQNALIQDGGLDASASRVGLNNRIVEIDVRTGAAREFLYVLDSKSNGTNEILAVNDHQFLVLERDGKAGSSAKFKKIFLIDIAGATDIRGLKQLPTDTVPAGVTPVEKTLFLDLLDPAYGIAGASTPEKFEGMAFGPDLHDGRHLLLVTTDNDFVQTQPSYFFAFAIDPSDLQLEPQQFGGCPADCREDDARDGGSHAGDDRTRETGLYR